MPNAVATLTSAHVTAAARHESAVARRVLIGLALNVVGVLIVGPVALIFYSALENGIAAYWTGLVSNPATLNAIKLTLIVTPIAVVFNTLFGIAAAWLIARFRFAGRTVLTTLIDLPFSISPVVVGLMLMLIFGRLGYLGPWLQKMDIHVVFALPGIVLATTFVTLPFVARELIPVMEALGSEEDTAAISLGASSWQMFWRVTLPNIKWGLLYGLILCNARAMGEFGAVYVVSGRIENQTTTMPLQVQKLLEQGNDADAFALASLLTLLALVTLGLKVWLERKTRRQLAAVAVATGISEQAAENIHIQ
ncbi:MAG TPA: sulfate ABC transporter permease subunit CysW [Pirellulales bacterium]|nr:sulfate ABC transporter permease subunit CysW [Pirellulales bacterium]